MSNLDQRIPDLVPSHYREYAPRFITFLEKYYEWLYRQSGLSDDEIQDLKDDTSWLEQDIDRFIATKQLKYLDAASDPTIVDAAIQELSDTSSPGSLAERLNDLFTMEGNFNTSPNVTVGSAGDNDSSVELPTIENKILDSWFNSMGMDRIKRSKIESDENIDQVLMLSLLKHIYAIKGTEASIKLFFSLFFEEAVEIYQPKHDIAVIDDNFVLDHFIFLRDDEMYQEYSYVVITTNPPEVYREVFDSIYLKTIHPSGFRVQLVQAGTTLTHLGY